MKIGQPLVLLLGGLLSASSVGCSAVSSLVRDDRPAAGNSQASGSAERLVSIGRVFENQGRYDQAEVMYRRALKKKPNDPIIRQQIAALVDRRNGRGAADPMQSAIAAADSLNGRRTSSALSQKKTDAELAAEVIAEATTSTADKSILQTSDTVADKAAAVTLAAESKTQAGANRAQDAAKTAEARILKQSSEFESSVLAARAAVADASAAVGQSTAAVDSLDDGLSEFEAADFESAISNSADQPSLPESPAASVVTRDQILAVIDAPGENHALLLSGLTNGDSEETRCLAATLLGECDKANTDVRDALAKTSSEASEERLILSAIDSQIQRAEADQSSAGRLIQLLKSESPDVQAQAASSLRCFTGTGCTKIVRMHWLRNCQTAMLMSGQLRH